MVASLPEPRRKFTANEIARMVETGILSEDEPVELISGELVVVSPQGPLHKSLFHRLASLLRQEYGDEHLQVQAPIQAGEHSLPEPDVAVLKRSFEDFLHAHPSGTDVLLAVEVALTSQRIDRAKAELYAQAGVGTYWILDVKERRLEVHQHPGPLGYGVTTLLAETEDVTLPERTTTWSVRRLLP